MKTEKKRVSGGNGGNGGCNNGFRQQGRKLEDHACTDKGAFALQAASCNLKKRNLLIMSFFSSMHFATSSSDTNMECGNSAGISPTLQACTKMSKAHVQ